LEKKIQFISFDDFDFVNWNPAIDIDSVCFPFSFNIQSVMKLMDLYQVDLSEGPEYRVGCLN